MGYRIRSDYLKSNWSIHLVIELFLENRGTLLSTWRDFVQNEHMNNDFLGCLVSTDAYCVSQFCLLFQHYFEIYLILNLIVIVRKLWWNNCQSYKNMLIHFTAMFPMISIPVNIYLFNVNNRNTTKRFENV